MSIEDRIFTMEDDLDSMYHNYVVYAPEKAGKTTFCSYAPNALVIDAEQGRASIIKTPNRPKIFQPQNVDDLKEVFIWLQSNQDKFDSVVLDTATEVESWVCYEALERQCKKDPSKDPDLITQNDYGKGSTRMKRMADSFFGLDMNTIIVCHERRDKDENTGKIMRGPAVMPSVMKVFNALADFIFYLGVDDEGERKLVTSRMESITAGHRIGELPQVIELGNAVEESRIDVVMEMIGKSTTKEEDE